MHFQQAVRQVFNELTDSLNRISPEAYSQPCGSLSGNTIGRHVRHSIEMFQCLYAGYGVGLVDYDKRKRDRRIEDDKILAQHLLNEIILGLDKTNKPLMLLVYYDELVPDPEKIESNYYREIAYNLEHTIHHMALLRIGLREVSDIALGENYGVAFSTVKHNRICAP